jgi:hypothetical protein
VAKNKNTFVVALKNIQLSNGVKIEKDDVGIIEDGHDSIFFIRIWQEVRLNTDDYQIFDVTQTGDPFPKKICNICHKLLPTDHFARNQNNIKRPVRRPSCQECRKTLEGITPTPKEKSKWLKSKPDLEPFECPICGKRTIAGVSCKVVLDHNHRTGAIRGWICDSCNTGIGRFKDDTELIKQAIKYVE